MRTSIPVATTRDVSDEQAGASELSVVSRLVSGFSIEATPQQLESAGRLDACLPAGTRVYVPYLPRAALARTVAASRRLVGQGLRPVPHLAARALPSRARLSRHLANLADVGADSLLLIAGDLAHPAGPFANTLDILDTGLLQRHGFTSLGIAGHPEGHPFADADTLKEALRRKAEYALETGSMMWIVTQFVFSAEPVVKWLDAMRAGGVRLPVRVGLPGPARPRTLLRYAAQCGIGASSRILARRPDALMRLLGRWTPDELLPVFARQATECLNALDGIHVFPFGGLKQSIDYFNALREAA
jgi:methylenetetrahydrofolate reductase (NADPH)